MWYAKASTAIIRNGHIIPAGTTFGIRESEKSVMDSRGFQVFEILSPEEEAARKNAAQTAPSESVPTPEVNDSPATLQNSKTSAPKMGGGVKVTTQAKGGK